MAENIAQNNTPAAPAAPPAPKPTQVDAAQKVINNSLSSSLGMVQQIIGNVSAQFTKLKQSSIVLDASNNVKMVQESVKKAKESAQNIISNIKPMFDLYSSKLVTTMVEMKGKVLANIPSITGLVQGIINQITDFASKVKAINFDPKAFEGIDEKIRGFMDGAWHMFKSVVKGLAKLIGKVFVAIVPMAPALIIGGKLTQVIFNQLTKIITNVMDAVTAFEENENVKKFIENKGSIFTQIIDITYDIFAKVVGLKDKVLALKFSIGDAFDTVKSLLSSLIVVGYLHKYAIKISKRLFNLFFNLGTLFVAISGKAFNYWATNFGLILDNIKTISTKVKETSEGIGDIMAIIKNLIMLSWLTSALNKYGSKMAENLALLMVSSANVLSLWITVKILPKWQEYFFIILDHLKAISDKVRDTMTAMGEIVSVIKNFITLNWLSKALLKYIPGTVDNVRKLMDEVSVLGMFFTATLFGLWANSFSYLVLYIKMAADAINTYSTSMKQYLEVEWDLFLANQVTSTIVEKAKQIVENVTRGMTLMPLILLTTKTILFVAWLKAFVLLINTIQETTDEITKYNFSFKTFIKLWWKLKVIKKTTGIIAKYIIAVSEKISELIRNVNLFSLIKNAFLMSTISIFFGITLTSTSVLAEMLWDYAKRIMKIPMKIMGWIAVWGVRLTLKTIRNTVASFHKMRRTLTNSTLVTMAVLAAKMKLVKMILPSILDDIVEIWQVFLGFAFRFLITGRKVVTKLVRKGMVTFTELMRTILYHLDHMASRQNLKALAKLTIFGILLTAAKATLYAMVGFVATILILTPAILLMIAFLPFILFAVTVFSLTITMIIKVMSIMASKKNLLSLLMIAVMFTALTWIATMLFIFALEAKLITKNFFWILGGLMTIMVTFGIIALFGVVASAFLPVAKVALIVIGVIGLIIFALLLVSVMLLAIGAIKLDRDAIRKTIQDIFGAVNDIILGLFAPIEGSDKMGGEDPGIGSRILGGLGRLLALVIGAPMVLAATLSVGAIMLMASMLWVVAKLNINFKKVHENVEGILNTIQYIIQNLFAKSDGQYKQGKGIFGDFINWVSPELGQVITSVLAFAYVTMMFLAITMITAMGGMLKVLSYISSDTIKEGGERAKEIIGTINEIMNAIFYSESKEVKEGKGLFGTFISWISPEIGQVIGSVLAFAYVTMMFLTMSMIAAMGGMLKVISLIDRATIEKAKENAVQIIDTINSVMAAIFRDDPNNASEGKGIFRTFIDWMDPKLGKVIDAIMAFGYVAMAFVTILMIELIANKLVKLNEITPDKYSNVVENTRKLFSTLDELVAMLTAPKETPEGSKKSWWKSALDWIGIGQLLDMLSVFKQVAMAVMVSSMISKVAESLEKAASFKADVNAAKKNVANMLNASDSIVNVALGHELEGDDVEDWLDDTYLIKQFPELTNILESTHKNVVRLQNLENINSKQILDSVQSSIGTANSIINTVVSGFSISDTQIEAKIQKIIGIKQMIDQMIILLNTTKQLSKTIQSTGETFSNLNIQIDDVKYHNDITAIKYITDMINGIGEIDVVESDFMMRLRMIDKLNESIGKFVHVTEEDVDRSKEITDNYIKFLKKIDGSDYRNLSTTSKLMEYWAQLAKTVNGNFNGIAEALNSHIAPMLDRLNETVDGVSEVQKNIIEQLTEGNKSEQQNTSVADTGSSAGGSLGSGSGSGGGFSLGGGSTGSSSTPSTPTSTSAGSAQSPTPATTRRSSIGNAPDGSEQRPFFVKIKQ